MLGSKGIREFTPEKAVFGGYDVKSIDAVLDEAAGEMEALEKENAELRGKMKVLSDKVEDYRRIESGIRQALMSAQNMAEQTVKQANNEAESIRKQTAAQMEQLKEDTKRQCEAIVHKYQLQAAQERSRYLIAQRDAAAFIQKMLKAFQEQSEQISSIAKRSGVDLIPEQAEAHVQVPAETMESRVEGPVEIEILPAQDASGTGLPEDIQKIFSDAQNTTSRLGSEDTAAFHLEISGSHL